RSLASISTGLSCCNDPAHTRIYTLSLHDALPISDCRAWTGNCTSGCDETRPRSSRFGTVWSQGGRRSSKGLAPCRHAVYSAVPRSEEHTSELQSRENLVCRLLLEKKKKEQTHTCA